MMAAKRGLVLAVLGLALLSGCNYLRLLRPSVLKQLNPDVVRLLNELPAVDHPNEEIIARLFAGSPMPGKGRMDPRVRAHHRGRVGLHRQADR